jgi:hypothetical protein
MGRHRKKRRHQKVEILADEQVEEEFGLHQPLNEADAKAYVFMLINDAIRALVELLDTPGWPEKLKHAEEAQTAVEGVVEECEGMQPEGPSDETGDNGRDGDRVAG